MKDEKSEELISTDSDAHGTQYIGSVSGNLQSANTYPFNIFQASVKTARSRVIFVFYETSFVFCLVVTFLYGSTFVCPRHH